MPAERAGEEAIEPIRRTVTVRTDPERAFNLFTEGMGTWWPLEDYSRAVNESMDEGIRAVGLEFQARPGGRILEHLTDGRTLPWGEVIAWEPPHRVVMAWHPHSEPEPPTEIQVTFTGIPDGTSVEVEHRRWGRLSRDFRESLYGMYARGWVTTLDRFVAAAH
jgi:uncharacterized protein YndB with AHSA1/START domain